MTENERFSAARRAVLNGLGASDGIGTLGERTLHAVLKAYYEPDPAFCEVPVGAFFADACRNKAITEIQTHDLGRLREKLAAFLPTYTVTVVYPIARNKTVVLTDAESGEVLKTYKSPRHGSLCDAYLEVLRIKDFLTHPNFRLHILFLDVTEYRKTVPKGRRNRRGSECADRIPESLLETAMFATKEDYARLLPPALPSPFTRAEFAKAAKRNARLSGAGIALLESLCLIEKTGKQGRTYLYEIIQGR